MIDWLEYGPAIRRWEKVVGRAAPNPVEPNKNGKPRLAADFDEWIMGLPAGWLSSSNLPYGAKIKMCGNGVVPLQAKTALLYLLEMEVAT